MNIKYFNIKGLFEIRPSIFEDHRGIFFESFREDELRKLGIEKSFIQDNQSFSKKNVIRGIHFQLEPFAQGKLVKVAYGKVLDVAIDLRPGSETFGKHVKMVLDSINHNMFYIPEGFGHGFLAIEDSVLQYKCTQYYNQESEKGIAWNDPDLNIDWGITDPIISEKDRVMPSLQSFISNII